MVDCDRESDFLFNKTFWIINNCKCVKLLIPKLQHWQFCKSIKICFPFHESKYKTIGIKYIPKYAGGVS